MDKVRDCFLFKASLKRGAILKHQIRRSISFSYFLKVKRQKYFDWSRFTILKIIQDIFVDFILKKLMNFTLQIMPQTFCPRCLIQKKHLTVNIKDAHLVTCRYLKD
jgi:hypothetical protein